MILQYHSCSLHIPSNRLVMKMDSMKSMISSSSAWSDCWYNGLVAQPLVLVHLVHLQNQNLCNHLHAKALHNQNRGCSCLVHLPLIGSNQLHRNRGILSQHKTPLLLWFLEEKSRTSKTKKRIKEKSTRMERK